MYTETTINIRFSDCDPMGHTNNAQYFTYMEQARVDLFRKLFAIPTDEPITAKHFPFILAEISCRYLKPTYTGQNLIVRCEITELKNSSFIIEYQIHEALSTDLVATGKSAQVWYDYEEQKSIQIPDEWREKMSK